MQINFTPHKIRAAKAYIENLIEAEINPQNQNSKKKKKKISFFRRILGLFRKS
jgi:hypothetical protein